MATTHFQVNESIASVTIYGIYGLITVCFSAIPCYSDYRGQFLN